MGDRAQSSRALKLESEVIAGFCSTDPKGVEEALGQLPESLTKDEIARIGAQAYEPAGAKRKGERPGQGAAGIPRMVYAGYFLNYVPTPVAPADVERGGEKRKREINALYRLGCAALVFREDLVTAKNAAEVLKRSRLHGARGLVSWVLLAREVRRSEKSIIKSIIQGA